MGAVGRQGTVRKHYVSKGQNAFTLLMLAPQGICDEAAARWDLSRVALAHRTGTCAVGEPSVMIAASSPHRRDALEVGFVSGLQSGFDLTFAPSVLA